MRKFAHLRSTRKRVSRIDGGDQLALLLRLPFFDRPAGVAPGGKATADMGDGLQPHVLRGLGRERRAQAARAVEDELLVHLEDRLGIRARRIDPELQHAARASERARYSSLALDFAGIADIDDYDLAALRGRDGF